MEKDVTVKRLESGLPGHFYAMEMLYILMKIAIIAVIAILFGIYLWGCGWNTPARCARNNGFVPASEISTTAEKP